MQNNEIPPRKFLKLLTETGRKVIKQVGLLVVIGILFAAINENVLKENCESTESTDWYCFTYPLLGDLGWNIVQIALTVWVIDIGLKRETLAEIQQIFNATQATKHIRGFYSQREEYNHLIERNLRSARNQKIKLLCLAEDLNIFNEDNMRYIRRKVIEGCCLEIILLHPDSALVNCLEIAGFHPNLNMVYNLASKLSQLSRKMEEERSKNKEIKGSIDIRLHKDLFSPVGYYSDSQDFSLVWMYFSDHQDGNNYPAFDINNQTLIQSADNHFDNLWKKTGADKILLKITKETNVDQTNTILSSQRGIPT